MKSASEIQEKSRDMVRASLGRAGQRPAHCNGELSTRRDIIPKPPSAQCQRRLFLFATQLQARACRPVRIRPPEVSARRIAMAPAKPREPSIERTAEYDDFLSKLAEYHEKRGFVLSLALSPCERRLCAGC